MNELVPTRTAHLPALAAAPTPYVYDLALKGATRLY